MRRRPPSTARVATPAFRSLATVVAALALVSCGADWQPHRPLAEDERALIERAHRRALADSAAFAAAGFSAPVELVTTITQDDSTVTVRERFALRHRPGGEFVAAGRTQQIDGDRELLASMYSFENSRGELRSETEARFTSVGFGADERRILADLLAGRLGIAAPIRDTVGADGTETRRIRFEGEEVSGALDLDHGTLAARRVVVRRWSSSVIGGYDYRMTLDLAGPASRLRFPVRMTSEFDFERVGGRGSGQVRMNIDTTAVQTDARGGSVE
ncbi:MAG TPA: hypothetical protein VNA88_15435 [Candidatus Kapabacteria bacterium]|nr:hypothetical protein [Candidatus Kapabacteria bacterium]